MRRGDAERPRGVTRHAGERFLGREAKKRAREIHRKQRRAERRAAGVVVGGDGDGHAVPAQRVDRRQPRLAQKIERAGQQHRDGAGAFQRFHARFARIFEMVG